MESISSDKREVVLDILLQVKEAIENLMKWKQPLLEATSFFNAYLKAIPTQK